MFPFVNTLGAILAPVYGIMIVDYYVIKKSEELILINYFLLKKVAKYYYNDGWNQKAFVAWAIAGVFSVLTVWHPSLSRFRWICMDYWCSFRNSFASNDVRQKI